MPRVSTAECFPENLLGAVESTSEVLARATTTGLHLMNQLGPLKYVSFGNLETEEGISYVQQALFKPKTDQPPLVDYDDTYTTTPIIQRHFHRFTGASGIDEQTFGPRESIVFHFFGYKNAHPLVSGGSVLLWNDGRVNFGIEQPFIEALPLDEPFNGTSGPAIEKMRLIQNIIHYGNRAALMSIGLAAASNLVEIPGETMEETTALQRRWLDIFAETAGQNYATHNGERYHPGIHLSLLSHYAVMDEY